MQFQITEDESGTAIDAYDWRSREHAWIYFIDGGRVAAAVAVRGGHRTDTVEVQVKELRESAVFKRLAAIPDAAGVFSALAALGVAKPGDVIADKQLRAFKENPSWSHVLPATAPDGKKMLTASRVLEFSPSVAVTEEAAGGNTGGTYIGCVHADISGEVLKAASVSREFGAGERTCAVLYFIGKENRKPVSVAEHEAWVENNKEILERAKDGFVAFETAG